MPAWRAAFRQHRVIRCDACISSRRRRVPAGGAYVFRHTVASRLVTRGANLKEVADFLGHQCLDTTAIYAKLDLPALREVALPWPRVLS